MCIAVEMAGVRSQLRRHLAMWRMATWPEPDMEESRTRLLPNAIRMHVNSMRPYMTLKPTAPAVCHATRHLSTCHV